MTAGLESVLVASSSQSVCDSIRTMCQGRYRVFGAEDLSAVYDMVAQTPIDVAIIDTRLRDADGVEAVRRLAADHPQLTLICIALSPRSAAVEQAQAAGIYAYVTKPLEREKILFLLEKAMERARLRENVEYLNSRVSAIPSSRAVLGEPATSGGPSVGRETLDKFVRAITAADDPHRCAAAVLDAVADVLAVGTAAFLMWDSASKGYRPRGTIGIPEALAGNLHFDRSSALVHWLVGHRQMVRREDLGGLFSQEQGMRVRRELALLQASLVVPLTARGELLAILALGDKISGRGFDRSDEDFLMTVARGAAEALHRAAAYERVARQRRTVEGVLDNIRAGIVAVDAVGKVTLMNAAAERLLRLSSGDVLHGNVQKLGSGLADAALRTLATREAVADEEIVDPLTKSTFAVTTAVLPGEGDEPAGAIVLFTDRSEVAGLKERVEDLGRVEFWSELAARMAHEIRNPLVSIKTFTQLFPERYSDEGFRRDFLNVVAKEVDKINEITEELVVYARSWKPSMVPTDMKEVVVAALERFKDELREHGVAVERALDQVQPVRADAAHLQRMFGKIIENAIEAMPSGGTLTVTGRMLSARAVHARTPGTLADHLDWDRVAEKDVAEIEFADSGRGIESKDIGRILTPFFSTKVKGLGLGLAVVSKIVAEHRGRIEVDSRPGKGTVVRVVLPLAE